MQKNRVYEKGSAGTMIKDECEFSRGDSVFRHPARCRQVALCENEREREIFPQPAQAKRKKRLYAVDVSKEAEECEQSP